MILRLPVRLIFSSPATSTIAVRSPDIQVLVWLSWRFQVRKCNPEVPEYRHGQPRESEYLKTFGVSYSIDGASTTKPLVTCTQNIHRLRRFRRFRKKGDSKNKTPIWFSLCFL